MAIGDIKAGRAYVEIGTEDKQLDSGLARAQSKLAAFGSAVGGAALGVAAIGAAAVAAGAKVGQFLVSQLSQAVEHASELTDTAAKLGVSLKALQEIRFVGGRLGVEAGSLGNGIKILERNLGQGKISKELASIGLSAEELKAMAPEDAFMAIADSLRLVENDAKFAGLAAKIFGRGGQELTPIIRLGSEAIKQMGEEAKLMGAIIEDDTIDQLDTLGDRATDLKAAMDGLRAAASTGVVGMVAKGALDVATEIVSGGSAETDTYNFEQRLARAKETRQKQAAKDVELADKVAEAQAAAAEEEEAWIADMEDHLTALDDLSASLDVYNDGLRERNKLLDEGKKIFDLTRTPQEKFDSEVARLKQIVAAGGLDADAGVRRIRQLGEELRKSMPEIMAPSFSAGGTFNPFAVGGLSDNDELTKTAKEQLKELKKLNQNAQPLVFN